MASVESTSEIIKSFPENFYDLIAYIFPSVILAVAPIFINEPYKRFITEQYANNTGTFEKFIFLIISFIILYVIGQMSTSVSWLVVYSLLGVGAKLCKANGWQYNGKNKEDLWLPFSTKFDRDWSADFIKIRALKPNIGLEVTKRYSRHILARNNALVGLILLIVIFYNYSFIAFVIILFFLIISFYDTYIRRIWFLSYVKEASEGLAKI